MSDYWQPYATAPKTGEVVLLRSEDEGPHAAHWEANGVNPLVSTRPGIWVLEGGGITWCDEDPDGAPTQWRPRADA